LRIPTPAGRTDLRTGGAPTRNGAGLAAIVVASQMHRRSLSRIGAAGSRPDPADAFMLITQPPDSPP
jgi:hypothetical protein